MTDDYWISGKFFKVYLLFICKRKSFVYPISKMFSFLHVFAKFVCLFVLKIKLLFAPRMLIGLFRLVLSIFSTNVMISTGNIFTETLVNLRENSHFKASLR